MVETKGRTQDICHLSPALSQVSHGKTPPTDGRVLSSWTCILITTRVFLHHLMYGTCIHIRVYEYIDRCILTYLVHDAVCMIYLRMYNINEINVHRVYRHISLLIERNGNCPALSGRTCLQCKSPHGVPVLLVLADVIVTSILP